MYVGGTGATCILQDTSATRENGGTIKVPIDLDKLPKNRLLVGIVGWGVLVTGIVLIPLPGPGWAITFVGLSILSREFVWARKVNAYALRHYRIWSAWIASRPLWFYVLMYVAASLLLLLVLWLIGALSLVGELLGVDWSWLQSPFAR